ncbi:MAG: isocitrate lyase/PEP mutase family protein [Betaproteobacteria bacterium]|nr:MAG: isocitrate lyase/PEP mutase family protein [Betaproteobacteria bacterium]
MTSPAQRLRELLEEGRARVAPAVFNPLSAKLAEQAGFDVLYLGGGTMGYLKCCLEANLNITELCHAGIEIGAVCDLPLILDAAAGFGDPMHIHHTIGMTEAAGFAAIEIEDQILPKRAHHHVGLEHMVPQELMVAKVREAVRARRNSDFVVIARTNAVRQTGMEDAVRRARAYREAGADMLYVSARTPDEARRIAAELPPPLMFSLPGHGATAAGLTLAELGQLGFRILASSISAWAFHRALKQSYECLARGEPDPLFTGTTHRAEQDALHQTIGMEELLAIERATVEK